MRVFYQTLFVLGAVCALLGCAGESRVFQETMSAIWQSGNFKDTVREVTLNPAYRYLRAENSRGAVLMILGYLDPAPNSDKKIIEVWYTGSQEVLRFQDGRVVGTSGLASDWLAVRYKGVPDWTQLLANKAQERAVYARSLDLKNNYQFGQAQRMMLTRIAQPEGHALKGAAKSDVVWFEEKAEPSHLPASIYAVVPGGNQTGQARVIYTWHCFSRDECFSFEDWTVQDQAKVLKP